MPDSLVDFCTGFDALQDRIDAGDLDSRLTDGADDQVRMARIGTNSMRKYQDFSRIGTKSNSDQKLGRDWWDVLRVMEDLNEEFDYMCWHRVETWVLGLLALSHAACFAGGVVFCWSASRRDATVTSLNSNAHEPAQ